jgi:hypothetical protein
MSIFANVNQENKVEINSTINMDVTRTSNRWNTSGNRILGVNIIKKALVLVLFVLLGGMTAQAQTVVRNGNTFTQVSKAKQKEAFKTTPYTYVAADGNKYPIYLSGHGKYFNIRKSKKTGKEYRQYLPNVNKELEKSSK